jgi:predicted nuclease of predicted toxin-antitoxin system
MKILADEGVDRQIVDELRNIGHEVTYVAEFQPAISDNEVLTRAHQESTLLLTADKDFGELVFRQRRVHAGVVLIRLPGVPSSEKSEIVTGAFEKLGGQMTGNFCVISRKSVRIRRSRL